MPRQPLSDPERRAAFRQKCVNRLHELARSTNYASTALDEQAKLVEVHALSALLAELDRTGTVPTQVPR